MSIAAGIFLAVCTIEMLDTELSRRRVSTIVKKMIAFAIGYTIIALSSVVETYADAAAIEAHFKGPVVQQSVPKLAALCTVDGFEIYGDPGPKVAAMATLFGAKIFTYWLGLNR